MKGNDRTNLSRVIIPDEKIYYNRDEIESIYRNMNILAVFDSTQPGDKNMYIAAIYPTKLTDTETLEVGEIKNSLKKDITLIPVILQQLL